MSTANDPVHNVLVNLTNLEQNKVSEFVTTKNVSIINEHQHLMGNNEIYEKVEYIYLVMIFVGLILINYYNQCF